MHLHHWTAVLLAFFTLSTAQCAPWRIRVLTYNIHHGEGLDGRVDLGRIAQVIQQAAPDVVALQEVDLGTERTGRVDQAAELGRLTGLHAVFGKAFDYSGGRYGAALLSRWSIQEATPHVLPGSPGHEIRPALIVKGQPGPNAPLLTFVSIHLDHQSEAERGKQTLRLLELLAPQGAPIVLAGDFNALPGSAILRQFSGEWLNATAGETRFTIPSEQPNRQIDFVLCHPLGRWRVAETRVFQSAASDHCALLAVLEYE